MCQLVQFSSRKVWKEEAVFTLGRESEVCSWICWLCLVSVVIIQGQCQALLETEEKDKPVFAWVLWQHQSPTSARAKVHVCWGCTSLSSTVGAASPLIPALPVRGCPWGFSVHSSHVVSVEVWPLFLGGLIRISPQLQYLLLLFLKYRLLPSLLCYLLHHSPFLPLICLSLLPPWAGEEGVAGIECWGSSAELPPCLPPGLTHFLILRKLNLNQTSVVVGGRGFTDEMHSLLFLFLKNCLNIF